MMDPILKFTLLFLNVKKYSVPASNGKKIRKTIKIKTNLCIYLHNLGFIMSLIFLNLDSIPLTTKMFPDFIF